jgi:hypothetical protein
VAKSSRSPAAGRRRLDADALASVLYDVANRLAADARAILRLSPKEQARALQQRQILQQHQRRVFEACGGNQSLTSDILGVHRRTFQRRMSGAGKAFAPPRGRAALSPPIKRTRTQRQRKYSRIDGARVVRLRAAHVSWPEIAQTLGCSETGAWRAFKRARTKS